MNNDTKAFSMRQLAPVMATFFVMGFVDLVGTATNYVKSEFILSDSQANLFTSMVFLWFLIFSVPTGVLMNKIGRRKTVLISIVVTLIAMLLPVIAYTTLQGNIRLTVIIISFAFLGIGNTFMQVSLNPLLTVFVKGDRLASTLTTGQFVKAFASFFAPLIATWCATRFNSWWLLYAIYLVIGVVIGLALAFDKIEEEPEESKDTTTIASCFKLLSNRIVLLCFLGIVAHVGIDVGINAQAPRI
ncbi:MAG: MFS transporter, partial [Bifidobacteriaceae bacterium]|nr:MFS transporter [Bifidobacteriaceae bacterium]